MRRMIVGLVSLTPLLAPASGFAEGEGRYQMERTADGFVRLDTVTGEVSICKETTGQIACRMAADERTAFENELDLLTRRVEALEKAQESTLSVPKPRLPTDEEIDRTMGIMERMMQRFMAIVKNLEGEEDKVAPQTEPLPDRT
jgi:exonuclease VII small subunit